MSKSIISVFKDSALSLVRNPILVIPTLAALIFIILFSNVSFKLEYLVGNQSTLVNTIWFIVFSAITLTILAYPFAGLIGMSFGAIKGKAKLSDFFSSANKLWLKNAVIMILIAVCYSIINSISIYGALYIGKILSLELERAKVLFYFIYFLCLIGGLIFLTFANFILISERLSIKNSIKKSASFVSNNYFHVLATLIILFVIIELSNSYTAILVFKTVFLSDLINSIIIYPYISLVLARFLKYFS